MADLQDIRALGFDLNGTILDDGEHFLGTLEKLFEHFGYVPPLRDTLRSLFGRPGDDWTALYEAAGIVPDLASKEEMAKLYAAYYKDGMTVRASDGVREVLDAAAAGGLQLAVVTTQDETMARSQLRALGIENVFSRVVGGVSDKTQALRALASDLSLPPGQIGFVGDQMSDIAAAGAAGVQPIGYKGGIHSARQLRDAARQVGGRVPLIGSFHELLPLLARRVPERTL